MRQMSVAIDINVKEALERLSLPMFFSDMDRLEAYYVVMEHGNPIQKILAEKAVEQFPVAAQALET